MPRASQLWILAARFPTLLTGPALHRLGLRALHADEHALAGRLFEHAAARYRTDLAVEALARLRAHQAIARARAFASPDRAASQCLEVEHRLARLNRIEALEPPFGLVDARGLLATWLRDRTSREADDPGALARAA